MMMIIIIINNITDNIYLIKNYNIIYIRQ